MMRCHDVQILVISLLSTSSAYILLDGYPGLRPNYQVNHQVPHPLSVPPPPLPPPLPPPPYLYRAPLPAIPWSPQVLPPPPVYLKGVFPPFIERIVQRIQTIWSVYNPPELLTRPPPPLSYYTTTTSPKRKPSTFAPTTTTTEATSSTTATPEYVPEDRIPTTATPTEVSNSSPDAEEETTTTATPTPVTLDHTSGVSTLAVYEVTPSTETEGGEPEAPAPQEPSESATPAPDDLDDVTSASQDVSEVNSLAPFDLAESDTEDTAFITPERASLLSHKEAYLRYLQTGKVPPYLESDRFNEMDDIFS